LRQYVRSFLVSALCALWLVSPISPVLLTFQNPGVIKTDTHFDKISELLLEMVRSRTSLRVLCDEANILNFYLNGRPGSERIHIEWFFTRSRQEDLMMYVAVRSGSYDVVIGQRPQWVLYVNTGLTSSYTDSYLFANSTRIITFTAATEGAVNALGPIYVFVLRRP